VSRLAETDTVDRHTQSEKIEKVYAD